MWFSIGSTIDLRSLVSLIFLSNIWLNCGQKKVIDDVIAMFRKNDFSEVVHQTIKRVRPLYKQGSSWKD